MSAVFLTSKAGDQGEGQQRESESHVHPPLSGPPGAMSRSFSTPLEGGGSVDMQYSSLQSWGTGKKLGWPLGGGDGSGGNVIPGLSDSVQDTLLNESSSH